MIKVALERRAVRLDHQDGNSDGHGGPVGEPAPG